MGIAAFVIALLLLGGAIDPTRGWLIALTVLTGLAAVHFRAWAPLHLRPALDVRLGAFVLALLLLAGSVNAEKDWFIALAVVTGLAAFMPGMISLDRPERRAWRARGMRGREWHVRWGGEDWP